MYKEELQKLINKIDYKIDAAKELRNKEIYYEIKQIDEKYETKILKLKEERNKLLNISYLDYETSINAINYLVSNIEEKQYEIVTIPIRYKEKKLQKKQKEEETSLIHDYFVTGLSKDKEQVEIKNEGIYTESNLNIPFVHFVKLAHFNVKNIANLKVNYLSDNYDEYNSATLNTNIDSFISDHRFLYIRDYIKKVIDYRITKDDFEITLDEMLSIADEFIDEYKNSKKLVKDIK